MTTNNIKLPTHFNCKGCKRRCLTEDDYYKNININGDKLDWTCLVKDEEIDLNLDKPNCYESEKSNE